MDCDIVFLCLVWMLNLPTCNSLGTHSPVKKCAYLLGFLFSEIINNASENPLLEIHSQAHISSFSCTVVIYLGELYISPLQPMESQAQAGLLLVKLCLSVQVLNL